MLICEFAFATIHFPVPWQHWLGGGRPLKSSGWLSHWLFFTLGRKCLNSSLQDCSLRDTILCHGSASIKSLQCLAGKIISFCIAVPVAKLYAREIYRAIAKATCSSHSTKIVGDLKAEIENWHFLDSWNQSLPWLDERHMVLKLSSEASLFTWGSVVENLSGLPLECHGLWSDNDKDKSIAAKEALAWPSLFN